MKQNHLLALAITGALLTGTPSLRAADDWLNGGTPAPAPAKSTDKAPSAPPASTPEKNLPPGTGGTGAGGWLFSSDGVAPTAQEGPPPGNGVAPTSAEAAAALAAMKQKDQFSKFWSTYARAYIPWDNDYVALPGYNPLYPSSKGVTTEQAAEKMGKKVNVQNGLVSRQTTIPLPLPEAQAVAMTLPTMEVGQYGFIHSFKVEKILGPDEMIVNTVWLIDPELTLKDKESLLAEAERKARIIGNSNDAMRNNNNNNYSNNNNNYGPSANTLLSNARTEINELFAEREKLIARQRTTSFSGSFKVKGYSTSSVTEGQRWSGPTAQVGKSGAGMQVAVIRIVDLKPDKQNSSMSRFGLKDAKSRLPEIVPAYYFRNGLTQEQFVTMLGKYGMSPDQFVDLVVSEIKADLAASKDRVFIALQKLQQQWQEQKKTQDEEARKEAEKAAKEAEKAAKEAEKAAKEAERKAKDQQRKSTK